MCGLGHWLKKSGNFRGGIWLPPPALFAMAAVSAAVHNLLQRHLPTRADDEIDGLVREFRHWWRGMADGAGRAAWAVVALASSADAASRAPWVRTA